MESEKGKDEGLTCFPVEGDVTEPDMQDRILKRYMNIRQKAFSPPNQKLSELLS